MLVTVLVVLGWPPAGLAVELVTGLTVIVQVSPALSVFSVSEKLVLPAVTPLGVTVPAQGGLTLTPGAAPSCMLASGSPNVTLVSAAEFGLFSVKTMAVVPPLWIDPGEKFFCSVGGESTTRVAVLEGAPALGVCVEVTPLEVFGWEPDTALVTVTCTVQLAPAARPGTVRLRFVAPARSAGELIVPTQLPPMAPFAADIPTSTSVKFRFVRAVVFALVMVSVSVLVPPCAMGLVPKAFEIAGGAATKRVAVLDPAPAAPVCAVATPAAVFA